MTLPNWATQGKIFVLSRMPFVMIKIRTLRNENLYERILLKFDFTFVSFSLNIVNYLHVSLDLRKTWSFKCSFSEEKYLSAFENSASISDNITVVLLICDRWWLITGPFGLVSHNIPETRIIKKRRIIEDEPQNAHFWKWNTWISNLVSFILQKTFIERSNINIG